MHLLAALENRSKQIGIQGGQIAIGGRRFAMLMARFAIEDRPFAIDNPYRTLGRKRGLSCFKFSDSGRNPLRTSFRQP